MNATMTTERIGGAVRALTIALAMVAALAPIEAQAQVLLQPVVLELQPRQRVVVVNVTLSERAPAPVRLQTELLRWNQDPQGRALTSPSDDLLVSPPIADLKPGQRQVFRVAVRNPKPLTEEAAYRLILEDIAPVPLDETGKPRAGLSIRMRYDLPVMVAPSTKATHALRWKPCLPEAAAGAPIAQACVRLRNTGNKRVKVQGLELAGEGWQQAMSVGDGGLMLAGAEREWRMPLRAAATAGLREVHVQTAQGESKAEAGGF